jgi:hypothetical protein
MARKSLSGFIRKLGVSRSAQLFDEEERTVKSWLYGERRPRPHKVKKILRRAKGGVTVEGIYLQ